MLIAADVLQPTVTSLLDPVMQCGFAAFALILLVVLVWGGRRLLIVLSDNSRVIEANTQTIQKVSEGVDVHEEHAERRSEEVKAALYAMRDKLMTRPCIASGEQTIKEK